MGLRGLHGYVWFCDKDAGRQVAGFLLGIERRGRGLEEIGLGVGRVIVAGFACGWSSVVAC